MQRIAWLPILTLVSISSLPLGRPTYPASAEATLLLAALRSNAYLDSADLPLCVAELPPTERSMIIQVLPDYDALRDVPDEALAMLSVARAGVVNWSDCELDPTTSLLDSWLFTGSRLRDQQRPAITVWLQTPLARQDSTVRSVVAYSSAQQRGGLWCSAVERSAGWHATGCEPLW